ncbi:MAG: lamin tail domain-containing protein [Ignavibacteria bacterium]|nr:lamin tail domain-containing protein [Ignavibacteria bacterium]
MKHVCLLSLVIAIFLPASLSSQLLISEVLPIPNGEPEWIELINTSNKKVRLDGWSICDSRSCVQFPESIMQARSTMIITRDADGLSEIRKIPSNVQILEFSIPSLNNTTDRVEIRNDDSAVVDSMSYNMKNFVKGRSIERQGVCGSVEPSGQMGDVDDAADECIVWSNSFAVSVATDSATCGTFNSVIKIPYDLRIGGIGTNDASVTVEIVNHGLNSMNGVNVDLTSFISSYDSVERKSVRQKLTSVATQTTRLDPGQTYSWEVALAEIGGYTNVETAELEAYIRVNDGRNANDKLVMTVVFPPSPGTISITEIMYDPWPDMKDYIEVFNGTPDSIDLTGWTVEDASGDVGIVSTFTMLKPQTYAALSASDGVRRLMIGTTPSIIKPDVNWNVTGDIVTLRTPQGFLVDRCEYSSNWHQPMLENSKGVSLEKYSPKMIGQSAGSWTSSSDLRGGTPGRANSVDVALLNRHVSLTANPSPFSSDRTHRTNPTIIEFKQSFQHAIASMNVYTPSGTHVRNLLNSVFSGSEGAVAWDGADDSGARVMPGQYVVVFTAVDAASSHVNNETCVVVVGE